MLEDVTEGSASNLNDNEDIETSWGFNNLPC